MIIYQAFALLSTYFNLMLPFMQ